MLSRKEILSCGGYLWTYEDEEPINNYYELSKSSNCISVDQYTLKGQYISTFSSCTDAVIWVNKHSNKKVSIGQIKHCCEKDNQSAGEYMWRFHGDTPPQPYVDRYFAIIAQYTKDGELIQTFNSLKEASDNTHIEKANICRCIKGRSKSAGGYVWIRE